MRPRRVFPGSVWAGWWWKGWKREMEQAEGVSALTRLRSSWGDTRWPRKHDAAKSDQGPAGRGPSRDLQPRQEEGAGRGQTGQWWGSRQGPRAEGRAGWPQGGAERGGRRSGKSVPALKAPGLMPSQVRAHPHRELPDWGVCVSPQGVRTPLETRLSQHRKTKTTTQLKHGRTAWVFCQRGHKDGQQAHEEMLSVARHQGNADPNRSERPPHTCQHGHHQGDQE